MGIEEDFRSVLQEMILPEFKQMNQLFEQTNQKRDIKIEHRDDSMGKRLGDNNPHLLDQSRRIDKINARINTVRDELVVMIKKTNKRIDQINVRIDQTNERMDSMRKELVTIAGKNTERIDQTNHRLDRICEAIVRKEDQVRLENQFQELQSRVEYIERRVAA